MRYDRLRLRHLLLTTSSAVALIAGVDGAQAAVCSAIAVAASNNASIDCIVISGNGNYANL